VIWTVGVALVGVAIALAWAVARRRPEHRFVPALLALGVGSDLLRQALRVLVLLPARASFGGAPYTGWARVAADVDNALFLAYPAGIAALALWVFLRRRPWAVVLLWAVTVLALAVAYPASRGEVLSRVYLAAELGAVVVTLGSFVMWFWCRQTPTLTHGVTLLIGSAELATLLPFHKSIFASWTLARWAYVTLYVILIVLHGGVVCGLSSPSKSS
jgi:hypothetical protein